MDSDQSSELFDSESKKLQDALESIQKKSDKTMEKELMNLQWLGLVQF